MQIAIPQEVSNLLVQSAPVAIGVSGGKDSHAVAWAVSQYLDGIDYQGPTVLIHADLREVEWVDSIEACRRISAATGWDLEVCGRPAGGLMQRWEERWKSSRRRYLNMETVSLVLPWSTPAMRFCTSELKVDPICSALKKRFGKVPILNVTGIRGEESTARALQPVSAPGGPKLPPGSLTWRPIHGWRLDDVWRAIRDSEVLPHEAYGTYGSTRVSCRFCILANEADLRASLKDPASHAIYIRMCALELESGFAFQGSRWLSSLAPELLQNGVSRMWAATDLQTRRTELQKWIPKHLQFTRGWPHCVPTLEECQRLAEMRKAVCDLYGWTTRYDEAETIRMRYAELIEIKQSKSKHENPKSDGRGGR